LPFKKEETNVSNARQYSAVHGAGCLAAKQMLKFVLPLKTTNNVDAAPSCFSV
jgi:hypothetical protein